MNYKNLQVTLPSEALNRMCDALGAYKYVIVLRLIAENPSILTHVLMYRAPCNNVPDQVVNLNKHIKRFGLMVVCDKPEGKNPCANSWQWYLIEIGES